MLLYCLPLYLASAGGNPSEYDPNFPFVMPSLLLLETYWSVIHHTRYLPSSGVQGSQEPQIRQRWQTWLGDYQRYPSHPPRGSCALCLPCLAKSEGGKEIPPGAVVWGTSQLRAPSSPKPLHFITWLGATPTRCAQALGWPEEKWEAASAWKGSGQQDTAWLLAGQALRCLGVCSVGWCKCC